MLGEPEYILGPDPEDLDGFAAMPLHRVHVLAGGSGTGKTRWLFQLLKASAAEQPFMGYQTQWHPVVYCAFDRQVDEQEETMRAVGLDPGLVPHLWLKVPPLPPDARQQDNRLQMIVRDILNHYPGTRVIIFDALYILAAHGQMNNYVIMAEWLQRMGEMCREMDLTIVGVVHTAKQRKGNEITDPRYSAMGSVATGGFTSCQVVVESPSLEDEDKRLVHIYPRNARPQTFNMLMTKEGLMEDQADEGSKIWYLETGVLGKVQQGQALTFDTIWGQMKGAGVSKSALNRYLDQLVREGRAVRYRRGLYGPGTPADTTGGAAPWAAA